MILIGNNDMFLINGIGEIKVHNTFLIYSYKKQVREILDFTEENTKEKMIFLAHQKLIELNYKNRPESDLNVATVHDAEQNVYKLTIKNLQQLNDQSFILILKDDLMKMETKGPTWKKNYNRIVLTKHTSLFLDVHLTGHVCSFRNNNLNDYIRDNLIPSDQNTITNNNKTKIISKKRLSDNQNVLHEYINNGIIFVPSDHWTDLNLKYDHQRIIHDLVELKLSGNILFPLKKITLEDVKTDFLKMLSKDQNSYYILKEQKDFFVKFESVPLPNKLGYLGNNLLYGSKSSNYFHQDLRLKTRANVYSKSLYEVWNSLNYDNCAFLEKIWHYKNEYLSSNVLYSTLALKFGIPSQFRPLCAKELIYYFIQKLNQNIQDIKILDPCAGWGDRLAGFMACAYDLELKSNHKRINEITLIEPRIEAKERYENQIKTYQGFFNHLANYPNVMIYSECAEIQMKKLDTNSFYIIFTSPPYYNREQYQDCSEKTQTKYTSYDNWCDCFLKVLLIESERLLIKGGYLIININNILSPSNHKIEYPICQDILRLAKEYCPNLHFVGSFGYQISQAKVKLSYKNKSLIEKLPLCEPIYVWQKNK